MTDVERRFGEAMFAIYREARDIGYTPSIFLRMLNEKGALQTARQLINASQPSDGYTRLWELRRLDLSVEAVVHDNAEWHDLFTQDELQRCQKRLTAYGYFGLYPGFATDDEVFPDPKRCRYRTGTAERKYGEFGRFLHKAHRRDRVRGGSGLDCAWTVRGLRRKRRPCAQSKDSRNELETPCRVEERLSILCTH